MKKILGFVAICVVTLGASLAQARREQQKPSPSDRTEHAAPNATMKLGGATLIPLNIKLGQWQNTTTVTINGALALPPDLTAKMTPEQRARYEAAVKAQAGAGGHTTTTTDKGCITAKDLTTDPFQQKDPQGRIHCHGTVLKSSSSDIVLQENCTGEATMNYTMKIHATDQEHTTGTGQGTATMGDHTMQSSFTFNSTWIGATCPNDSNQ